MTVSFCERVQTVTESAIAGGALLPIPTTALVVEQHGLKYLVRVLDNLKRKDEARARLKLAGSHETNPFLPYDEALYVGEVGEYHRCLLNKFNVVDHHLLIVTREFEAQSDLINLRDFSALAEVMAQLPGLAFYNAGELAGASQPHKHLQLIPLPMAPFAETPFSEQLRSIQDDIPQRCDRLAFNHAVLRLPSGLFNDVIEAGSRLLDCYRHLRAMLDLAPDSPYNLLLTRDWMLMVPRTAERWQGISFNALAFCGAILVRDQAQAEQLREAGIMQALVAVSGQAPDLSGC
ncbi:hypothetical protein KQ940_08040 [Marinobacterium sp. D7]|uniref:ATP adenylyltransferase family protein n=1 Tax=Marinobacterium ramblicola TaxID=2849041 RepID=UPI001C2D1807|nr:hypothetical protein [Marinobacterium ramblicola]